ncbi:hypothetical protein ACOSP7_005164 [Xanthoceras sorbifolium]
MGKGIEKSVSFICILVLVLVVSDVVYAAESRTLRGSRLIYRGLSSERLYVRAKKTSGPSPGIGHRTYGNVPALGKEKNSGPTLGEGHRSYGNVHALGKRKNSGPSPGKGHKHYSGNKQ